MIAKIARLRIINILFICLYKFNKFIVDRVLSSLKFRTLIKNSGIKSFCHFTVEIKFGENISIGDHTRIGPKSTLGALENIIIGSNVVVSKEVIIETAGLDFKSKTFPYKHKGKKITIEDNVWIGARAVILGGVTIGKNSIIGAGVVISKDVKADSVIVGNQPRVLTDTKN